MATAAANPQWIYGVGMPSTYPDFDAMKESGTGLVVADNLPGATDLIAAAKEHGVPVAIHVWADPDSTPEQYAAKVAYWQQFAPDVMQLNIETPGKGYGPRPGAPQGDPGWQWSEKASQLLAPIVQGTKVSIGVMGQQDDFNYAAYMKNLNADFWVETYAGDMSPNGTPQSNVDRLVANGVPRDRIVPILGPGQTAPDGNWISFGMPNSSAAGVYKKYATVGGWEGQTGPSTPAAHGSASPGGVSGGFVKYDPASAASQYHVVPPAHPTTGPGTGGQDQYSQVPDTAPAWSQVTDAHNTQAQAYARSRLAQFGIRVPPGQDAAAAWREFSAKFYGARAEAAAAGPVDQGQDVVDVTRGAQPPQSVGVTPAHSMGNILAAARVRAANAIVRNPQLTTSGGQPVPTPGAPSNTAVAPGIPAAVTQPPHIVAPPSAVTTPIRYAPSAPTRITQEDILAAARSRAGMI